MKNPIHLCIDFETIGRSVLTAPIVSIAYGFFDWSRFASSEPYSFEELATIVHTDKFNVKSQIVDDGYTYTKEDFKFWSDMGPEGMAHLKPSAADLTYGQFAAKMRSVVEKNKVEYWWSRSNAFDPILLQRIWEQASTKDEFDRLFPYWGVRDTRTYIDAKFDFGLKNNAFCPYDDEAEWNKVFFKHNPQHDVIADILRLQKIERICNECD